MELLSPEEIKLIAKRCAFKKVISWSIDNYSKNMLGYLGDHMSLRVVVESEGKQIELKFFLKCMPRFDKWKAEYLRQLNFFEKEYVMLNRLFNEFNNDGSYQWRPKVVYIKDEVFIFQDVSETGYVMPWKRIMFTYDQVKATVEAMAKFHAESYIYEERKTKALKSQYRIYENFSNYLQEPLSGKSWRNTGRKAVVDYLKVYSKHKGAPKFSELLNEVIPKLFEEAWDLMQPSLKYRNVIVHRDLWANNIFFKQDHGKLRALLVDFQTVLYCQPMIDLSSFLFFNTTRDFRSEYTDSILNVYYQTLSNILSKEGIDINNIFEKSSMIDAYEESLLFGIIQAAIIVPTMFMDSEKQLELFNNPATCEKVNTVSRSEEFIEVAKEDAVYRNRVTELFDEIVETYVFSDKI